MNLNADTGRTMTCTQARDRGVYKWNIYHACSVISDVLSQANSSVDESNLTSRGEM